MKILKKKKEHLALVNMQPFKQK